MALLKCIVIVICVFVLIATRTESKSDSGGDDGSSGGKDGGGSKFAGKGSISRRSLLAGLEGSTLGLHLGHKLGNGRGRYFRGGAAPMYSVTHHYHHGDRLIAKNAKIDDNITVQCNNVTFCVPNTQPLCLDNGTIYCLAPMNAIEKCIMNFSDFNCINTSLTVPCLNAADTSCNETSSFKNETAQIPCLTNLFISEEFSTGNLSLEHSENSTEATGKNSIVRGSSIINAKLIINRNLVIMSDSLMITNSFTSENSQHSSSVVTETKIIKEFCVVVIADPIYTDIRSMGWVMGPTLFTLILISWCCVSIIEKNREMEEKMGL